MERYSYNSLVTILFLGLLALHFVQIKLPFSFQISYYETVSIPKSVSGSSLSSFEGFVYRYLPGVVFGHQHAGIIETVSTRAVSTRFRTESPISSLKIRFRRACL